MASARAWDVTDMHVMALVVPLPFGSDKDLEATVHNLLWDSHNIVHSETEDRLQARTAGTSI